MLDVIDERAEPIRTAVPKWPNFETGSGSCEIGRKLLPRFWYTILTTLYKAPQGALLEAPALFTTFLRGRSSPNRVSGSWVSLSDYQLSVPHPCGIGSPFPQETRQRDFRVPSTFHHPQPESPPSPVWRSRTPGTGPPLLCPLADQCVPKGCAPLVLPVAQKK